MCLRQPHPQVKPRQQPFRSCACRRCTLSTAASKAYALESLPRAGFSDTLPHTACLNPSNPSATRPFTTLLVKSPPFSVPPALNGVAVLIMSIGQTTSSLSGGELGRLLVWLIIRLLYAVGLSTGALKRSKLGIVCIRACCLARSSCASRRNLATAASTAAFVARPFASMSGGCADSSSAKDKWVCDVRTLYIATFSRSRSISARETPRAGTGLTCDIAC